MPLKTREEKEKQEATVNLADAKEISVDIAFAAFVCQLKGTVKEKQITALKAFLVGKMFLLSS